MQKGFEIFNNYTEMAKLGLSYEEALKNALEEKFVQKNTEIVHPLSVAIMAHGYNLFDEHISMNLINKLKKMGVNVYTSLNVSREEAVSAIEQLGEFQYWANELELTGVAAHYLLNGKADGIIALSAFGCGPDSLMFDEVQYHAKDKNIPIIHLTIDEHTGEAGFITRIEAFVDMLVRRQRLKAIKDNKNIQISSNKTALNNFISFKKSDNKQINDNQTLKV